MHTAGVVEVIGTDEFNDWYLALGADDAEATARAVDRLQALGVALGFPHSSAIKGAKRHALRELRIQSGGRPLRVFYVFDPKRQAILLLGGDKSGDSRFYEVFIPKAERIFDEYLREQREGRHEDKED